MERIDSAYVAYLHQLPFNPYSQYVTGDEIAGSLVWRICALNDEATHQLIHPMMREESIELHALGGSFDVSEVKFGQTRVKDLTDIIYSPDTSKMAVRFITPVAFKSKGEYVIVPSTRLIFQNLLMRYEQIYSGSKEIDSETVDYLSDHSRITAHRLRSRYFANVGSKSGKIPAFMGDMTISINGPQTVVGMVKMLLKFGEYSGLGIKTSMGMGAMKVE